MTDDPIAADADIAARYLAALLARHVPNTDAVQMTTSYMGSLMISRTIPRPPREPWEVT